MKNYVEDSTDRNRDELMMMREEMHQLKTALESQKIINEQLLRNALRGSNARVRNWLIVNVVAVVVATWGCYSLSADGIIGIPLTLGTVVIMLAALVVNVIINRISNSEWVNMPLTQLQELLIKRRQRRMRWQRIGIGVAFLWLLFYVWELYCHTHNYMLLVSCAIGFAVGGSIGMIYFRKLQRADMNMVKQIRKLMLE